ncbi:MAG: hypothetical protein ACRD4S_17045 [Candidatus Acidiferrales bacterium]
MKPTIGRIVIYKYAKNEQCNHTNHAALCPAVIVRVWSDTCVNLKLLEDGPLDSWKTSVALGDRETEWSWPVRE